jgi:hypothetical protein
MVGQRRISISPLVGGIWKWELVLLIWWNYLYQWQKFHWKTTGGSKFQKIEIPRRSDLTWSTDLHNTWIGNRKTGTISIIIISGSLGTLKDRWNFWTFGIKVYNHNQIKLFRNTQNLYLTEIRSCCDPYITFKLFVILKIIIASRSKQRVFWQAKGIAKSITTIIGIIKLNFYEITQQANNLNRNFDWELLILQVPSTSLEGIIYRCELSCSTINDFIIGRNMMSNKVKKTSSRSMTKRVKSGRL